MTAVIECDCGVCDGGGGTQGPVFSKSGGGDCDKDSWSVGDGFGIDGVMVPLAVSALRRCHYSSADRLL